MATVFVTVTHLMIIVSLILIVASLIPWSFPSKRIQFISGEGAVITAILAACTAVLTGSLAVTVEMAIVSLVLLAVASMEFAHAARLWETHET